LLPFIFLFLTQEEKEQVMTPKVKPVTERDEKTRFQLYPQFEEQGIVIVHCRYSTRLGCGIRIWSSTFLIDRVSGSKSRLLHAFNISFAPVWTIVPPDTSGTFTLIFESLPKRCAVFDLIEEIPEAGGFEVFNIERNGSDVYSVNIDTPF
jgi:hypothetical protein